MIWLIRSEIVLVCIMFILMVPFSRRTIITWLTYFSLRTHPDFQEPEWRDWLWQRTKDRLDGKQFNAVDRLIDSPTWFIDAPQDEDREDLK